MRILQLAIGWLALCGLTAAGTYYAMIEVDQQFGLQARIAQRMTASASPAPIGTTPPSSGPSSGSLPPTNPVTTPPGPSTATPAPIAGTPATGSPATGTPSTGTPATGTPATGAPATPAPVTRTPVTPPAVVTPVRRPPPSTTPPPAADTTPPAPRVNLGPVQARFNELYERAKDLDSFYGQREAELRQQGMQLNSSMKNARTAMAQYINAAAAAIRSGNAAMATQALNLAEPKIQYLEDQK